MIVETIPKADLEVSDRAIGRSVVAPSKVNWRQALEFLAIVAQLVLLAVLIKRYNIESPAFIQMSYLVFAGFAIHYFLPLAYRLPFFLALSVVVTVWILDWEASAWLMGIGLVLVGLCHLPVAFGIRLALIVGFGGILAAMRGGWLATPVPSAIWPILGSMFMFRMMVYLYDLRFRTSPVSATRTLSYFFMLPNVCFPLFPVVDYQSYCINYYDEERHRIYNVGVRWIFRGVVQLILYRIVYKNWAISVYEVENAGDFAHYCLWQFLMYLRVSGQFHIIVGMLHLFGFNLPETHHLYYWSSSFTDFWRRINIYWKDFMMKLFFYPAYFRLKQYGPVVALVMSTLVVFFVTWLLHAVQKFWIIGSFSSPDNDIVFWTILAGLVVVNSVWELKRGRKRLTASGGRTWPASIVIGIKTLATFTTICFLWSMWTSKSLSTWWSLREYALVQPTPQGWLLIAGVVVVIFGGAVLAARYENGFGWARLSLLSESAGRCTLMLALGVISLSMVNLRLGQFGKWIASSKYAELNIVEMGELERGYYEDLLDVNRFNGELWTLYSRRPIEWRQTMEEVGVARKTSNFLRYEFVPSKQGIVNGAMIRTNSWGMHDDEYTKQRPAGCYRIAVLGASTVVANGVDRDVDFETLVEKRLNRENTGKEYKSYELLNFAVSGYTPLAQVWVLQDKALAFETNAVFYVGHGGDVQRALFHIVGALRDKLELPDPYLRDLIRRAGVDYTTPEPIVRRRLKPFGEELSAWMMKRLVEICKTHDIVPVFILLPEVGATKDPTVELRLAREAGFKILDLTGVYAGHWGKSLWIAEWNAHPNPEGHQLIADRLYKEMQREKPIPMPEPKK